MFIKLNFRIVVAFVVTDTSSCNITKVQLFNCSIELSDFQHLRNASFCNVTNEQITFLQTIDFSSLTIQSDQNIEGIVAVNMNIDCLPKGLSYIFPNLKILTVTNSHKLVQVKQHDLNYTFLEYLNLSCNKIDGLESNLFKNNKNLKYLDLHNNNIKIIGLFIFRNISDLGYVNFLNNSCISSSASNPSDLEIIKKWIEISCSPMIGMLREEINMTKKSLIETRLSQNESQQSFCHILTVIFIILVVILATLIIGFKIIYNKILSNVRQHSVNKGTYEEMYDRGVPRIRDIFTEPPARSTCITVMEPLYHDPQDVEEISSIYTHPGDNEEDFYIAIETQNQIEIEHECICDNGPGSEIVEYAKI